MRFVILKNIIFVPEIVKEQVLWDLIVSVPDHCLSFYFVLEIFSYRIVVSARSTLLKVSV